MDYRRPKPQESSRTGLWICALAILLIGGLANAWLQSGPDLQALSTNEVDDLATRTSDWIESERNVRRPAASALKPEELEIFAPFFPPKILENTRILDVEDMPFPGFVENLQCHGQKIFRVDGIRGLALDDTLLLKSPEVPAGGSSARWSVLFHELVHAVQYEALGVDTFIDHYLDSLVAVECRYPDIVFEHQAFELQRRFMRSPRTAFSVEEEVAVLIERLKDGNHRTAPLF